MYLHIGENSVIRTKNIIAVLNMETATVSKDTKNFLKTAQEEEFIKEINTEIPKTFIVSEVNNKSEIYLTNISPITLKKRIFEMQKEKNKIENIKEAGRKKEIGQRTKKSKI